MDDQAQVVRQIDSGAMASQLLVKVAEQLRINLHDLDPSLSFTGHGGHSLSAIALSHACKAAGISLSVGDILRAQTISSLHQQSIRRKTSQTGITLGADVELATLKADSLRGQFEPCDENSLYSKKFPATEMQLSLIRGTYANPQTNVIYHRHDCEPSEIPLLRNAWEQVIMVEPIFQANFEMENGVGFWTQNVNRSFPWKEVSVNCHAALELETLKPPSFSGIGYSFTAITAEESTSSMNYACLLFQVHHALIDGHSMELLLKKVADVRSGVAISTGPSFLQFLCERDAFVRQHQASAVQLWAQHKELNSRANSHLGIPSSSAQGLEAHVMNDICKFDVGICKKELAAYAKENNITEASIYYAAWALMMSLLADSDCVLFGVALSGRTIPIPGVLEVIGSLVTTLPIAFEINQCLTTVQFLRYVFGRLNEMASCEWALPDGCYDRNMSSIVAMQYGQCPARGAGPSTNGLSSRMNSEVPLSITIEVDGWVNIQYSGSQYKRTDIERLGNSFCRIVAALLKPTQNVSMCLVDAISLEQQRSLLKLGNCFSALTTKTSVQHTLVSLFCETSKSYPQAIAAERGGESITYGKLDMDSDRISSELTSYVREGEVVCVHADQSISWLIAIYSVLKSGAVYCPLNPNLSPSLRASTFLSSGATVFLMSTAAQKGFEPPDCLHSLVIDEILLSKTQRQDLMTPGVPVVKPSSGAYLCFTSGSTGKPKGVLCTHRGLVAFQRDLKVRLFAQPGRRVAQTMSVSFDGSIHEVFSTLSYGATLVLPDDYDPFAHLTDVDAALFTPSLANVLKPSDLPKLDTVYLVGEQVSQELNDRWGQEKRLYNMYGPTEGTCGATIQRLLPNKKVTIGVPNSSTRIYILDRHHRLTMPGWLGQICLAGVQVANGYIGRPDATQEKFVPDPISDGLGESMYCTGDLGYWNEAGEIVLLGRTDRQVKLRGFRLDLDDIEVRISKLPSVSAAAVACKDDHLVAMVQPSTVSTVKLQALLATILPVHATPRFCVAVDKFPLTKARKLDYGKVRDCEVYTSDTESASMNEVEMKVARAWQEVLKLEDTANLGPDSNFSLLGGHSLDQLRLASRLSHAFTCQVPIGLVIDCQRLRDQALSILELTSSTLPEGPNSMMPSDSSESCSPIETWWAKRYSRAACTTSFNVSIAYELDSSVDKIRLMGSWNTTLARHSVLSSRYTNLSEQHFQRTYSKDPPIVQQLESVDLRREINRPFDIERDELVRVYITSSHMLVVVSHIICDLTTMQLVLDDISHLYNNKPLLRPSISYPACELGRRSAYPDEQDFWTKYLAGSRGGLFRGPLISPAYKQDHTGTSVGVRLPTETVRAMDLHIENSTSLTCHQLAVAAVALALQVTEPVVDITIGSPYLNRHSESDQDTVGLFLEPLPMRISCPDELGLESSVSYLSSVQASSQAALSHAIPWSELRRIWVQEMKVADQSIFDVMVTFHEDTRLPSLEIEGTHPLYVWAEGAKFPLMCEFFAIKNEVLLRVEYDTNLLSHQDVMAISERIAKAILLLTTKCNLSSIRQDLRKTTSADGESSGWMSNQTENLFLRKISDISTVSRRVWGED